MLFTNNYMDPRHYIMVHKNGPEEVNFSALKLLAELIEGSKMNFPRVILSDVREKIKVLERQKIFVWLLKNKRFLESHPKSTRRNLWTHLGLIFKVFNSNRFLCGAEQFKNKTNITNSTHIRTNKDEDIINIVGSCFNIPLSFAS